MLYLLLVIILFFTSCNKQNKTQAVKIEYIKEQEVQVIKTKSKVKCKTFIVPPSATYNFYNVKYLYNYDGDTIRFEIPKVHPLLGHKASIRLAHIDTPELKTKNLCEKAKAKKAKKLVQTILSRAKRINLKNCIRGKYFRLVCDILVDKKDLKNLLIKEKLGYKYEGGHKKKVDWCK